jgi:hypothetical protein
MNLSTAINYCKVKGSGQLDIDFTQLAAWLQELKTHRTLGAAVICDLEFSLLDENEIERDKFIAKYVERGSTSIAAVQ